MDRLWSLAPWWYIYIFAYFSDWHPRLVLCCVVSTLWGVRLTFNFWRKGGYTVGDEDYRWANIQKDLKKLAPKYHRHLWLARTAALLSLSLLLRLDERAPPVLLRLTLARAARRNPPRARADFQHHLHRHVPARPSPAAGLRCVPGFQVQGSAER